MYSLAQSVLTKGFAIFLISLFLVTLPLAAAPDVDKARVTAKIEAKHAGTSRNVRGGLHQRVSFNRDDQDQAIIAGVEGIRFWGDSEEDFLRAVAGSDGPWLSLSGGGADGAFGAGLLAGWSRSGTRPEFAVVYGVSTGALAAPFAFLGPRYDEQLRIAYTTIGAADIFELNSTSESLLDNWPLRELITKKVTPELMAAIAQEHRRGRRLFVVTTNLDAGRPVLWNMGAIADRGGDQMLRLFRDVLIASTSVPGLFPPVAIEAEAGGRTIQEMHNDGTLNAPFYVAPQSMLSGSSTATLPMRELYVVINGKLTPEFSMPEQNTISVLGRSIGLAFQFGIRSAIAQLRTVTERRGIAFNLAFIDAGFSHASAGAFDSRYMGALYDFGLKNGAEKAPFLRAAMPSFH